MRGQYSQAMNNIQEIEIAHLDLRYEHLRLAGRSGLNALADSIERFADRSTPRAIKLLSSIDLLVIDELGYLTLTSEQCNAFFKLMEERYGKKSTIITTNLEYEKWYGLFNRKELVDALLDRLRHHCTTIRIQGESLRTSTEGNVENRTNV